MLATSGMLAERNLLVPIDSEALAQSVPAALRDPENRWFGFSKRARTLAYNTEKVSPDDLSSYEDLADPKWRGKLCLRTSKKVYNQSLVAALIAHHGEQAAEEMVKGWVANLAVAPFSNDTKALQAVAMGQCDVTIVNSYYYGRLMREEPDLKLALFWPNQDSQGVHVNVSGGGLLAKSRRIRSRHGLFSNGWHNLSPRACLPNSIWSTRFGKTCLPHPRFRLGEHSGAIL